MDGGTKQFVRTILIDFSALQYDGIMYSRSSRQHNATLFMSSLRTLPDLSQFLSSQEHSSSDHPVGRRIL